jgi:hypothetical protein
LPRPVASGWISRRGNVTAFIKLEPRVDEPIALPGGKLVTLRDAANYITALPRKEADAPEWQAAIEALMLVVEFGGPTMMARIGVMRALNRGHVREFNPSQKQKHRGRRKLRRDL